MKNLSAAIVLSGVLLAAPCLAQTAQTPGPLTTPGSMNNTRINPATGTPYVPQVNMNSPVTPQSTAINPATGTYYQPQVNMNGPATNNPGVVNTPATPVPATPAAPQQPNTTPQSETPQT